MIVTATVKHTLAANVKHCMVVQLWLIANCSLETITIPTSCIAWCHVKRSASIIH